MFQKCGVATFDIMGGYVFWKPWLCNSIFMVYNIGILDVLSRPFCPRRSVPPFCPFAFLSRLSVPLSFRSRKCHFVPPIKRGRERPRGKAAEEVELETDDQGSNPMPLQPISPLQLQPLRGGLLHIFCSKYNLIFIYYQLVCLEKVGTVSPTFAS